MTLNDLLAYFIKFNASELYLLDGLIPKMLINKKLQVLDVDALSKEKILEWLKMIAPKETVNDLEEGQAVCLPYSYDDVDFLIYTSAYSFKVVIKKAVEEEQVNDEVIIEEKDNQIGSELLNITDLLDCFVELSASDLHLVVGVSPKLRINGNLEGLDLEPLTADSIKHLIYQILPETKKQVLNETGGTDFSFSYDNYNRFRVNILKQRGNLGAVLRLIPNHILSLEEIGVNPKIKELLFRQQGLILVTGPTGSGKSTTMAAMINFININRKGHILTIEEPIEFYHEHKQCVINQREVGVDVLSFSEALRGALRQDPDIILVGEMRDLETIKLAVTAAETGHLVFGTLHTNGAAQTINRVIDVFPDSQQSQVRTQLANSLTVIISQQLLKRQDKKGRIAAFEVLVATNSIRALIRDDKIHQIATVLQTGAKEGMNTLDDHLISLYEQGIISSAEFVDKCDDRKTIQNYLGKN